MDVVRAAFQKLGGMIDINSQVDIGTTITIKMPLTLAILPSLIVTVEQHFFAIPQISIEEVVWLHGIEVYQSIKNVNNRKVYRLRGKFYPLLILSELLDVEKKYRNPTTDTLQKDRRCEYVDRRHHHQDVPSSIREQRTGIIDRRSSLANNVYIIVLRHGSDRFGLMVDSVVDSEELVIKAMHEQLQK